MVLFSTFNLWLFAAVHQFAGQFVILDYLAIFFAQYIQYVITVWFAVMLVYPPSQFRNRTLVLVATLAACIARLLVKPGILLFIAEPRPFVYLHFIPLVTVSASENMQAFPSGHALFFFALAMTTFLYHRPYGLLLFLVAVLMGLARIFTGVHWPLDIVWGALLGMLTGYVTYKVFKYYSRGKG